MTDEDSAGRWDLTPVISLLHALSNHREDYGKGDIEREGCFHASSDDWLNDLQSQGLEDDDVSILGNFEGLWAALGKPVNAPAPIIKWDVTDEGPRAGIGPFDGPKKSSYVYRDHLATPKGVRWRDGDGVTDLEDNDEETPQSPVEEETPRSCRRRKRPGKRERQRLRLRARTQPEHGTTSSGPESEGEVNIVRTAPSSFHSEDENGTKNLASAPEPPLERGEDAFSGWDFDLPRTPTPPPKIERPSKSALSSWPVSQVTRTQSPIKYYEIGNITGFTAAERKINIVMKLIRAFPDESDYLVKMTDVKNMSINGDIVKNGIHVFVDSSNIMIGFHDSLKTSRGIPIGTKVRRVKMSFHNLAMILERGRPVAKRVLVGSKPLVPAIREAQECGYETNVLDRVLKTRERDRSMRSKSAGEATSGSETTAVGKERLVEQAVDEILHLKLLESLLDVSKPATIVLATGDAAEAEYSAGFLRMVERALERGWNVELVSFSRNTSFAYKRRDWRRRWTSKPRNGRFKIIELDTYQEELLDM